MNNIEGNTMNDIIIRKFSPELMDDYLNFFDNVGFSDHGEWSWCYCTSYHFDDEMGKMLDHTAKTGMRNEAILLIKNKIMEYGQTAYNRIVCASSLRSLGSVAYVADASHGGLKRRIQPER